MADEAKRAAQEALFGAIQSQAENNMRAALSAPEKATLLRDLAEAYRLTAGGSVPDLRGRADRETPREGERSSGRSSSSESRRRRPER